MRYSQLSLALAFTLTAAGFAQDQIRTDAMRDGYAGPIRSVSSLVARTEAKWQQPGGPTLVTPIWCKDCDYDRDGTKTKSGDVVEGKFFGEIVRLVRDANGNVTDRYSMSSTTGELQRHEIVGPFGKIEQTVYVGGKLNWRQTYSYDEYGHLAEWRTFDRAGKQESRFLTKTLKDGTITERSVYDRNGELNWQQTFDPETSVDHFTTFDPSGLVTLTWTVAKGKLVSFWEPSDSPSKFGDNFNEPDGEGNVENFHCRSDLHCDVSQVHYEYLDSEKRNPQSAEWRDADGNLQLAAYFEYQLDSHRNWTYRRVWVWDPSLGQRTLYETDVRAIAYWDQ